MIDRIKQALTPIENPISEDLLSCFRKENNTTTNYKLNIMEKNYNIKAVEVVNLTSLKRININNLNFIFRFKIIINSKDIYKIDISSSVEIEKLLIFLNKKFECENSSTFINHDSRIFTKNIDKIKEILLELDILSCTKIEDSKLRMEKLCLNPGNVLLFFNGINKIYELKLISIKTNYDIKIAPIKIIKDYSSKNIVCKGCCKNLSVICVLDDPILPQNEKYLCKSCFNDLFLTKDGKLKYEDMKFHYL